MEYPKDSRFHRTWVPPATDLRLQHLLRKSGRTGEPPSVALGVEGSEPKPRVFAVFDFDGLVDRREQPHCGPWAKDPAGLVADGILAMQRKYGCQTVVHADPDRSPARRDALARLCRCVTCRTTLLNGCDAVMTAKRLAAQSIHKVLLVGTVDEERMNEVIRDVFGASELRFGLVAGVLVTTPDHPARLMETAVECGLRLETIA